MNTLAIQSIPALLTSNLNFIWGFLLLLVRYITCLSIIPGLGGGVQGTLVRVPFALILSYVSIISATNLLQAPDHWSMVLVYTLSELVVGLFIGIIPLLLVSALQLAGQISSTSMGLGSSQIFDPTSGASVSEISRIYSDIGIILFFMVGGHHVIIYALSGMGGSLPPGFLIDINVVAETVVLKSVDIFRLGALIASPVLVSLLLVQFVMGLISKAVPQVNIFIMSFPLTIGIGLIIITFTIPTAIQIIVDELRQIEDIIKFGLT